MARGQAEPTSYGNMDLMFANMVSSGLCVPIHQPQTHLCNLGGNLSEKRWAAESPPHCLAGPDEISKHTAARASSLVSPQQTRVAGVCQDARVVINYRTDSFISQEAAKTVNGRQFMLA